MAFTCPRCDVRSHHPEDARQGYCGACGDWTGQGVPGEGTARSYQCETCGSRTTVPPEHVGRVWCPCGSARTMAPAPWVVAAEAEFRPSDIQVVADPSVPPGEVRLSSVRGHWQFSGYAAFEVLRDSAVGTRVPLSPEAAARLVGFITIPHTDYESPPDSAGVRQPEVDDFP